MSQIEAAPNPDRHPFGSVDMLVLGAMFIVSAAIAAGLLMNVGLGLLLSGVSGIAFFAAMVSSHLVLRRERAEVTDAQDMPGFAAAGINPPSATGHATQPPRREPPALPPEYVKASTRSAAEPAQPVQVPPSQAGKGAAAGTGDAARPAPPHQSNAVELTREPEAPKRDAEGVRAKDDLGAFVPGGDAPTYRAEVQPDEEFASTRNASIAGVPKGAQIETIIKRLADDITAGRRTVAPSGPPPLTSVRPGAADAADKEPASQAAVDAAPTEPPAPMLVPVAAVDAASQAPMARVSAGAQVAAIAEALMAERIDVLLEPIHGLEDNRARHYEVFARVSLADGEQLDPAACAEAVRGTGLLPLIEAVKVSQTKRVAMQLMQRGRDGSFFSQVDGEALATDQFGEDVGAITGRDPVIATRLVLSFSQSDVRGFTPAQWRSLEELQGLGFRFAIESVTDLDMDFERLAESGFQFAKLDAEVFIAGLPIGDGAVPAADICKYLASMGLTLIVQSITSERQLVEILGFGALFGQGTLFGGPRPVKAQALRDEAPATATAVRA